MAVSCVHIESSGGHLQVGVVSSTVKSQTKWILLVSIVQKASRGNKTTKLCPPLNSIWIQDTATSTCAVWVYLPQQRQHSGFHPNLTKTSCSVIDKSCQTILVITLVASQNNYIRRNHKLDMAKFRAIGVLRESGDGKKGDAAATKSDWSWDNI